MSIFILLITATATLITSISGFIIALRKIKDLHVVVNSRLDQLLKTSISAARAEGVVEGKESRSS
jgi:hypothetical protein